MLVAVRPLGSDGKHVVWLLQCDCGGTKQMVGKEFAKLQIKTCGCSSYELVASSRKTHGDSKYPLYAIWRSMLARCFNPRHKAYPNYGGRGITVCQRWLRYENFKEDMIEGYAPGQGLEIDRQNNNRGYFKSNCRWVLRKTNLRNKRTNTVRSFPGFGRVTVSEAAERSGINVTTILYRISRNWPDHLLLTPPDLRNKCTTSGIQVRGIDIR